MASQAESIDIRCPSCQEPVQSKWKCCPFCETRLECPSRKASTHVNLPESYCSNTDVNEIDPQLIDSIDFGSACIEKPVPDEQPLVNADDDIGSDSLEITLEEYLREFEEAVWEGGVANLSGFITDDLNKWREIHINIAVIGESGTGKSYFINAIRGLQPGDEFYAATGSKETTTSIQQFPHPEHHNLVFWDLPGVGTQQFPKESYLSVIDVKKYDFFILVSATRFKENDAWLAKEIRHLEKKFYFVRSKIDFDVQNDLMDSGERLTKEDIINNLRQNTLTELMKTGVALPKLFLVNNKNIHEYDFKDLITQLINDIPDLKKDTLIMSMSSLAKTILDEKRKLLRRRSFQTCIGISLFPSENLIPGTFCTVDIGMLLHELKFYKEQFGTDDNSLKIIAVRLNTPFDDFVQKLDIQSTLIVRSHDALMSFLCMSYSSYEYKGPSTLKKFVTTVLLDLAAIRLCLYFNHKMLSMCFAEALRVLSAQQNNLSGNPMFMQEGNENCAK